MFACFTQKLFWDYISGNIYGKISNLANGLCVCVLYVISYLIVHLIDVHVTILNCIFYWLVIIRLCKLKLFRDDLDIITVNL